MKFWIFFSCFDLRFFCVCEVYVSKELAKLSHIPESCFAGDLQTDDCWEMLFLRIYSLFFFYSEVLMFIVQFKRLCFGNQYKLVYFKCPMWHMTVTIELVVICLMVLSEAAAQYAWKSYHVFVSLNCGCFAQTGPTVSRTCLSARAAQSLKNLKSLPFPCSNIWGCQDVQTLNGVSGLCSLESLPDWFSNRQRKRVGECNREKERDSVSDWQSTLYAGMGKRLLNLDKWE